MKVLVTGATGLIGFNVVQKLLKSGYNVNALVRAQSNVSELKKLKINLCNGDLLNAESIINASKDCSLIFHMGGTFAYWGYKGETFKDETLSAMRNVVNAALTNQIPRVIFASSSVTCGATNRKSIISEIEPGNFDDAPVYVTTKKLQEELAFELGLETGVEIIAACPTITVGSPDNHLTESNRIILNYMKDPYKATWYGGCNIVSVKDVAKGIVILAGQGIAGNRYIIGGENWEWKQLHAKISELTGMPGPHLSATHASSFMVSSLLEFVSSITGEWPASTREQAKMVGNYYWYSSDKIATLGYKPGPAEDALIETISWLVTSPHVSPSLRAMVKLSDKIYQFRNNKTLPLD